MMDKQESYFSAVKQRLNLQAIGSFLLTGSERVAVCCDSYQAREKAAFYRLEQWLTWEYGDRAAEQIIAQFDDYTWELQDIYFSLGMKAGATLQCKLTDNFETDI
mgnify:FL=1